MKLAGCAALATLLSLAAFDLTAAALAADAPLRPSYGHQEHVRVVDATPIEVIATLEPGAEYSILNAIDIKFFQRQGDMWVRFTVDNGSVLPGNHITLERAVLKDFKVQQRDGSFEHQPRVAVELCLGVQDFKTEVRLVEREGYTAPLILGQPDLSRLGTVDSLRKFTQEPRCIPPQPQTETLPQNPVGKVPSKGASINSSQGFVSAPPNIIKTSFSCDGRTYCSQMTSCAEAKFFLNNCPGAKMDGDHNGVPCESQWCSK